MFNPGMTEADILAMVAHSQEFEQIKVGPIEELKKEDLLVFS